MPTTNQIQEDGPAAHPDYTSATVLSAAANYIMNKPEPFTHTYRTYIRVRESGKLTLKFWYSNAVDSTWDQGQEATGSEPGGNWQILGAYVADGGIHPDGSVEAGTEQAVRFAGEDSKEVAAGERFWSDEAEIELAEGHYLAFTWTLMTRAPGKTVPYNVEGMLATAYDAPGYRASQNSAEGFTESEQLLVLPAFVGYKKNVERKLIFLGDSITQGVRTRKDAYEYWVAGIADGLGTKTGVWNLGSGWGRAYDAAEDGPWLNKAKQGDTVLITLGVNDLDIGQRTAEELELDLETIIDRIHKANPAVRIWLSTVPPFNFAGEREEAWRTINNRILTRPPEGVERVFDIASVLSMPAPQEHRVRVEYMSGKDDPHPNGLAGAKVADAFLKWIRA